MAKRGSKPDHDLTFEEALAHVESIIERIETGEVGLERSIAEYERGMTLLKRCREMLRAAEQKVEEVTARMQDDAPPADDSRRSPGGPGDAGEEPPF